MQIIVRGTNVTVTPGWRQYAERKVGRLTRMLRDSARVEVIQHVQREFQEVEIIVEINGTSLRAKDRTTDMYASIDAAVDKIERQLKKIKDKKRTPLHRERPAPPSPAEVTMPSPEEEPGETPRPLPRRSLFSKPMTEEEAVLQINASGETIFVFRNVTTQQTNVLHRLSDGSLELIEPEAG